MGRCCTPLTKVDMVLFVLGFWHALTFKVILNISWELWTMFHAASQCRECGSHKTQTVPCYTFATLGSEQKSEKGPLLPLSPLHCKMFSWNWIRDEFGRTLILHPVDRVYVISSALAFFLSFTQKKNSYEGLTPPWKLSQIVEFRFFRTFQGTKILGPNHFSAGVLPKLALFAKMSIRYPNIFTSVMKI